MRQCQPPDPDTKVPSFVPPDQACDTHCHVFGPASKFPYAPDRTYTPPDAPAEALRRVHAILGIDRAVIVQATCHGNDNSATLDAIARSGGKYRGVAMVDGTVTDAELARLDRGGIRGVRFAFARHLGKPPEFGFLQEMAARIAPYRWHLVLYLESEDIVENLDALQALRVPVVIDHMGRVKTQRGLQQTPFRALLDLLRHESSFWVKICGAERISAAGPPYADAVPFARALVEAAPDRVLWGTDWPHPNIDGVMPNDGDLLNLLAAIAEQPATRKAILVDNPHRLYQFHA